jgi:hypothetical protein
MKKLKMFGSLGAACCAAGLAFSARAESAVLQSDEMYPLEGGGVLHVFRKDGTLKVKSAGDVSFVLVGGGGAGGSTRGGGGGAGGVVTNAAYHLDAGDYPITVGRGQVRAFTEYILNETGAVKTNRTFTLTEGQTVTTNEIAEVAATATMFGDLFTAYPGGRGGDVRQGGKDGASGGGAGGYWKTESHSGGAACYADKGNLGHAGGNAAMVAAHGAGGGGAGSPGEDRSTVDDNLYSPIGGRGGTGVVTRITGKDFWVGGGGNGMALTDFVPGGGGIGGSSSSTSVGKGGNGAPYTGGGGGGSGSTGNNGGLGGDGGSGVVLVRTEGTLPETIYAATLRATGGTTKERTLNGERWCIHTFTEDGTLELPAGTTVEMLLVGGGGGGGNGGGAGCAAGGGGGGRVIVATNYLSAGSYAVVVGQGGGSWTNGTDTTFFGYCAKGGGAGGSVRGGGASGGCGGGGGAWGDGPFSGGGVVAATNDWGGIPIDVSYAQYGFPGGAGNGKGGAGGGGAGAPGADVVSSPSKGGDGFVSDITGEAVCYGGGGGGGGYGSGGDFWDNAGAGGGGKGGGTQSSLNKDAKSYGLPGTDGLGGGGGGGGGGSNSGVSSIVGGKGGSGVVIVRYRVQRKGLIFVVR